MISSDNGVDGDVSNIPDYFPVLTTFAKAEERARTLSALGELSFVAGRAGDDFDDWVTDMLGAVDEAFPNLRLNRDRRARLCVALCDIFKAGTQQRSIDEAGRPAEALRFARGWAVCHEFRCEHEYGGERSPNSHKWAAATFAHKLARYLPITAQEAAACVLEALAERSYRVPMAGGDVVLEAAERGVEERLATEAYERADEADDEQLLDSILRDGDLA